MGAVPGYEHDVFISYGHSDDTTPSEHWVRDLVARVEGRLHQIFRRDVSIWRDPRLMAGERLESTIRQAIERSAVFVSVLTPAFVEDRNGWCRREAEWFRDAVERDRLKLGAKSRIIPVEKYPVEAGALPDVLSSDTLAERFYRLPGEDAPPEEYSNDAGLPSYGNFTLACDRLAHAILNALTRVIKAQSEMPVQPQHCAIFIAAVPGNRRQHRDALVAEFTDRGYTVVQPSLSVEATVDQFRQEILDCAARADVAVHIVGDSSPSIDGRPLPLAQFAIVHQCAAERGADRPLRQVVWLPSDTASEIEEVRRSFVAAVAPNDADGLRGVDVLGGSIADLKERLIEIATAPAPSARAPLPVPAICLVCRREDIHDPELRELRDWFILNDWATDVPALEGPVELLAKQEQQGMVEANATLIFYGSADPAWVKEKRKSIQQAWAEADDPARLHRAVYLSIPDDELKAFHYPRRPRPEMRENDGYQPLLILGDCGRFDVSKIQPLVDRINPPGDGGDR